MSPTWIWMQIAIVVFVVIGMVVAIVKLALVPIDLVDRLFGIRRGA